MRKIAIKIAYSGVHFYGFAPQNHSHRGEQVATVFAKIKSALVSLGIDTGLEFAGRTDRGVHAKGQVVSFCIPSYWSDIPRLIVRLHSRIAPYISISKVWEVPSSFSPRYSAKRRLYLYVLSPNPTPFEADFITQGGIRNPKQIKEALLLFIGQHNFEYFAKNGSNTKSFLRTIDTARLFCISKKYIFAFRANGFVRSQVRLMVGALLALDRGVITLDNLQEQLQCQQIHYRFPAPPDGLYLQRIVY